MRSKDIRIENKREIFKIMLDGGFYTKQAIAEKSGLSIPTVNTLLNEMTECGMLSAAEEKQLRGVGRGSVLYTVHAEHDHAFLVNPYVHESRIALHLQIVDALGHTVRKSTCEYEHLPVRLLTEAMRHFCADGPSISQTIVAVPGVIDGETIRDCDAAELNGVNLAAVLEEAGFDGVCVCNDLHLMAKGYNAGKQKADGVTSLCIFEPNALPGTVTIHKGQVISGANGTAGMAGYLPFGSSMQDFREKMKEGTCEELLQRIVMGLIAFLNPSEIVFAGGLVNESFLTAMREYCLHYVPKHFLPALLYRNSLQEELQAGMLFSVLERKHF